MQFGIYCTVLFHILTYYIGTCTVQYFEGETQHSNIDLLFCVDGCNVPEQDDRRDHHGGAEAGGGHPGAHISSLHPQHSDVLAEVKGHYSRLQGELIMNLFALGAVNFVNPQIGFTHIFENTC